MRDPTIREKVRVRGREGLFLVIRIDSIKRVVSLLPLGAEVQTLDDVSFDSVELPPTSREEESDLG